MRTTSLLLRIPVLPTTMPTRLCVPSPTIIHTNTNAQSSQRTRVEMKPVQRSARSRLPTIARHLSPTQMKRPTNKRDEQLTRQWRGEEDENRLYCGTWKNKRNTERKRNGVIVKKSKNERYVHALPLFVACISLTSFSLFLSSLLHL